MRCRSIVALSLPVSFLMAVGSPAMLRADPPAKLEKPEDFIAARQALMVEMEEKMQPIDSFTVGVAAAPAALDAAALEISKTLATVPSLFPPATNLYDPKVEQPVTIALPAIWKDFATFEKLAAAASASAKSLAAKTDADGIKAGALALRGSCDACHTLFLRPYTAAKANEQDANFDFDKLFKDADEAQKDAPKK
ncbi:MAG TPA: cytochrome c [Gammaproteobacteria bacterium]|nr:cytochrome c [Gammaproteobacteria bacterium]